MQQGGSQRMFKGLSRQQTVATVIIVAVAIVGWIVAIAYQQQIDGLQDALATAENDRSATADRLTAAQQEVALLTETAARLEEAELALDEYKAAVGSLEGINAQIEDHTTALAALTPVVDAKTAELSALQDKVEALEIQTVVYEAFTAGGPYRFQTSGNVNVRTGPTTDADVLVVLPPGTDVEVFEVVEDGQWYKVGGVGYIFHDLLQPNPEAD